MKKAQFEILGLAVIVIIVSVLIFFTLLFTLGEDEDIVGRFGTEQFAQNVVDAILKTDLEGCRGTVADYLAAQATGRQLSPIGTPDQLPTCATEEGLEEIISAVSTVVNEYQNRPYRLEIRERECSPFDTNCPLIAESGECNPRQDAFQAGFQPISLYPLPNMQVALWVC